MLKWMGYFVVVAMFVAAPVASAQQQVYTFDIPPQTLDSALRAFAQASKQQILFDGKLVQDKHNSALIGDYPVAEALAILLKGTGLGASRGEHGAFVIAIPSMGRKTSAETVAIESSVQLSQAEIDQMQRVNLAASQAKGQVEDRKASLEKPDEDIAKGIPEILVRGSAVLNADIRRTADDIQPYMVLDREVIEKSGARSVDELLKYKLTMATSPVSQSLLGSSSALNGNTSSINLRGLGKNQTLILVDGRRAASLSLGGAPAQPDLNGIPLSAIERIEVLPATASGIYGGGATGGVVNVVLRRDYAGIGTQLTYDNSFKQDVSNRRMDISAGFSLEGGRTNVLFAASYSDAGQLLMEERDLFARGRAHVLANNPAAILSAQNPPLGATVNIRSSNGTNLTLKNGGGALNSPITYVPRGYAGPASDNGAALRANAGQYNHELADTAQNIGGGKTGLLNSPTVKSGTLTLRREMMANIEAFLDLSASNNQGVFLDNPASSTFLIANTEAVNPFDQSVRVTIPAFGADGAIEMMLQNRRASGGAIVKLPADWTATVDHTWNRTRMTRSRPGVLDATAAGNAVSNGTINAFRDPNVFGADFSSYLFGDSISVSPVHTMLRNTALRFSGPIGSLPAGQPTVATLVEYRDESFDDYYSVSQTTATPSTLLLPSRSQSVRSVYLEANVPIVSEINKIPGVQLLELQLAARHDDYETKGANALNIVNGVPNGPVIRTTNQLQSTDPTVGLRYQPLRGVIFRGSYGTGFLPPAVNQLIPGSSPTTSVLTDPRRGNAPLGSITLLTGGDPNLRPEESESRSIGLILQPAFVPRLRFSVDWTRIVKTDNIRNLSFNQENLNQELLIPGLVTREMPAPNDPFGVGRITAYSAQLRNVSRVEVEAYDFSFDYQTAITRAGAFNFSLGATKMDHMLTRLTPLAPTVEMAGVSGLLGDEGGLKWKFSSTLEWEYRQMSLTWATQHFDSYYLMSNHAVVANQGSATVPSQTYHDLIGTYRFAASQTDTKFSKLASGARITAGIKNVFNKEPPIEAIVAFGSLYSNWGDPRLRSYFLSLNLTF